MVFIITVEHNSYDKFLEKRLVELEKNVAQIKERIDKYPQGTLKVKKEKSGFYYRIVDKNEQNSKYIGKKHIIETAKIAQRDYDYSYLKIAEKEMHDIERLLSKNYSMQISECYSDLHEGRKILVRPFEISNDDLIKKWMSIPYKKKEFNENDTTEYYTERGERVRSKSEVIIANILLSLGIPYKYECPIYLDKTTVYPDFTVLDVEERCEKYIEHFGMMGDADYVANMMLKINTYEKNGIYLGDNLICTFESAKRPLNSKIIRNKINALLNGIII